MNQKSYKMNYFDEKQKKLINSWHSLSESSEDYYMAYIAEWITFNAICYNLYHEKAVMERANIDRAKSKLRKIQERLEQSTNIVAEDTMLESKNERWNIDIHFPDRLFLSISKRYTEDIIFDAFTEKYSVWYNENLTITENIFADLKSALKKHNNKMDRHFVINMARSKDYSTKKDIDEMAKQRIIFLFEKNELWEIKDVLYQIRCNIFHGEKTPGDVNDDRIVRSALPILRLLVNKLIAECGIKNNA